MNKSLFDIPFTKPTFLGREVDRVVEFLSSGKSSSAKDFVAEHFLRFSSNKRGAFFCSSCTGALELAGLAAGFGEDDEIIVPDFTFVTSASAFALRNAKLVFCDVSEIDLCLNLSQAEASITPRTKAIVWVDYAGNSARAQLARSLCDKYGIIMIQDSAQSVGGEYGQVGMSNIVGDFVAYSFHRTKNVTSGGEGGLLLVRNENYINEAELAYDKGTNRRKFLRGEVDKYTWRRLGSSFEGADTLAAWLVPQLEELESLTCARLAVWKRYLRASRHLVANHGWRIPKLEYASNGHIFWLLAPSLEAKVIAINAFESAAIQTASHYQSLWNSHAGKRFGVKGGDLNVSVSASQYMIRLPLWHGINEAAVDRVCGVLEQLGE